MGKTTLSERLRATRKALGWTQKDLSKKAKVSQQTISNIESGITRNARDLVKLARALGVSSDYLAGATSESNADELYDLILELPESDREAVLMMLRKLAGSRQPE